MSCPFLNFCDDWTVRTHEKFFLIHFDFNSTSGQNKGSEQLVIGIWDYISCESVATFNSN